MKRSLYGLILCFAVFTVPAMAQNAGDIALGAKLYEQHCAQCHDNGVHMLNDNGPALFGVYGRRVGSLDGFDYSESLLKAKDKGQVWTSRRLDQFLTNPNKMYPGTSMPMSFSNTKNRRAVIAYIKTLK